jgi:hypothetical protein
MHWGEMEARKPGLDFRIYRPARLNSAARVSFANPNK